MANQPRAMLVVDISPFGESLPLIPAMKKIRSAFPGSVIAAAACTGTCELLAAYRLADEAIDMGVIKPSGQRVRRAVKSFFRLVRHTRGGRHDLILDFSPQLETQIACRLGSRARTLTPSGLPFIFDLVGGRGGEHLRASVNGRARYVSLLRQLGLEPGEMAISVDPPAESSERFEQLLWRHGSRGGEPVVILYTADAGGSQGSWPVERFGELAGRLVNNFGARVLAADVPSDTAFTGLVGGFLPGSAIRLTGPGALDLAAALARASLVVTDDPGLAELALGLGTSVIELGEPSRGQDPGGAHCVVRAGARATPDEVFAAACEMLQKSRTASLFHRP